MNTMINSLLESMSLEQFSLAFILIAVVFEAIAAVIIVETYLKIKYWNLNRRLSKFDEFEYKNDLY